MVDLLPYLTHAHAALPAKLYFFLFVLSSVDEHEAAAFRTKKRRKQMKIFAGETMIAHKDSHAVGVCMWNRTKIDRWRWSRATEIKNSETKTIECSHTLVQLIQRVSNTSRLKEEKKTYEEKSSFVIEYKMKWLWRVSHIYTILSVCKNLTRIRIHIIWILWWMR